MKGFKKTIAIVIFYKLNFCSSRKSEDWSSGFKTLAEFMNKYNLGLSKKSVDYNIHEETELMQEVNVEQKISIPLEGKLKEVNLFSEGSKLSIKHLTPPECPEWLSYRYHPIKVTQHNTGLTPNNYIYLLRIKERKEWVGIATGNDYEWTLGTVNDRYTGPCSLDEASKKIIESTYPPHILKHPRFENFI